MSLVPPVRRILPALLLVLVPVLLGPLAFHRKVESFQPLGIELSSGRAPVRVAAVTSPDTGLEPGDAILLVDSREVGNATELGELLGREPESRLFVLRAEQGVEVSYLRPALELDFPYLFLALLGLGYLAVGLYALLRDGRPEVRLFYVWCVVSSLVFVLTTVPPFDLLGKATYLVEEIARLLLPALTLQLFLAVPRPRGESRRRRWIPFLYLPAAVLAALQADLIFTGGRWLAGPLSPGRLRLLDRLELAHLVFFAVAAVAVLALRWRRHAGWEGRRQAGWLALGLGAGYLPFLLLYFLPFALGLRPSTPLELLAVLPLALVPITFSWAVLRFRLQDLGVLVRNGLSSALTVLLGAFVFSLLHVAIQRSVPDDFMVGRDFLALVAGLLVAGVVVPARRGIASSLERFHYRGTWAQRRALGHLSQELLQERDPVTLARTLGTALRDAFDLRRVALYQLRGRWLYPLPTSPEAPTLDASSLLAQLAEEPRLELSGLAFPGREGSASQRLYLRGFRYLFPLSVHGNLLGVVAAGYKGDGEPLNTEDSDLLRQLLDQAALALENARLLDELQLRLEEVTRLEKATEAIIDYTPAGLAVLGSDDTVVDTNSAFARIVGRSEEEVVGRSLAGLLPVSPLPRPEDGVLEVSYCLLDGTEHHLQLSIAQVEGEARRVLVAQDIGEQVALRTAMKEKERLADLGMLAAGVAHEVNTPLTGISSYAQMLLAETPEEDPRHDLLKKVETQTFRASRIVNDLLRFSRRSESEARPVPVGRLLDECLELLRERIHDTGIEVALAEPERRLAVLGHEGELHQVFLNLIRNAVDVLTATGGRLSIEVEPGESTVEVRVRDDGPGIPGHQLDRIFQPFVSTKLDQGGTGLGLAISYNIVRRHHGQLRVESAPGEGTCFTVELPRAGRTH